MFRRLRSPTWRLWWLICCFLLIIIVLIIRNNSLFVLRRLSVHCGDYFFRRLLDYLLKVISVGIVENFLLVLLLLLLIFWLESKLFEQRLLNLGWAVLFLGLLFWLFLYVFVIVNVVLRLLFLCVRRCGFIRFYFRFVFDFLVKVLVVVINVAAKFHVFSVWVGLCGGPFVLG